MTAGAFEPAATTAGARAADPRDTALLGADQSGCMWPRDLLECDEDSASGERNWWLVYTRSRQEKRIAEELRARETPFFLPLTEKRTYARGRVRRSIMPLFSGYMFLFGGQHDRLATLQTNRVSNILPVADGDRLKQELRRLAHLLDAAVPLNLESRLQPGQLVRVRSGPFRGFEGQILRREGKTRLAVCIDFIQMGASIMVEDCCVEAL